MRLVKHPAATNSVYLTSMIYPEKPLDPRSLKLGFPVTVKKVTT